MLDTVSEVKLVFWILSQINILCTSLVKPCYAEKNNLPFMCHDTYLFCNLSDFIEVDCSTIQNVLYFIKSKIVCSEFHHS